MKQIIIAIDGPAGSGKTTSAKITAEELNYIYIDTGAMYRACTLFWLRTGLEIDEKYSFEIMEQINIDLVYSDDGQLTILNGEDVSDEIRHPDVTAAVSPISAMKLVREKMVAQQRQIAKNGGVVMDGRDIGTVVFPNADLKLFFTASPEKRAIRRMKELAAKGIIIDKEVILQQIVERDRYDSTREIAPLKQADDAILIDNTDMTLDEQSALVLQLAQETINRG